MMIFTHMLMGALLGFGVALLYPGFLPIAVGVGLIGGGFPDLDMVFTHRRTLHFPILSPLATAATGGLLYFWPTTISIGVFCFFLAAAIHSLTDILGGGKEMRPWRETDDRAVYNHVTRSWIRPLRVFYDGSLVDLGLSVSLASVLYLVLPREYRIIVVVILVSGIIYSIFRRYITRQISEDYQTFSEFIQHKLRSVIHKS